MPKCRGARSGAETGCGVTPKRIATVSFSNRSATPFDVASEPKVLGATTRAPIRRLTFEPIRKANILT